MAINTTGFTQVKTIYVDFDQERKPSLRDIGSDQIGANGAKLISFGFGNESLAGFTVILETKRVADGGLRYAIAETYTDNSTTRYKVPLTDWFTMYRSQLVMAVKVFNNSGVTVVDGEITAIDNDYLITVSDTFTLTVNYAPKATAVVPSFTATEIELILSAIAGKQDTANSIVVLQEEDALPDVSDGTKNGWTYLKKNADYSYSVYKVVDDALELIQENLFKRVSFDTSTPETTLAIGTMAWSQEHRCLIYRVTDEVVIEVGQEFVFDSKASGTVNNGYPVFFVAPQGDHALSKQATATDVLANPYGLRGIATHSVSTGEFFKTTQLGRVDSVDTTAWAIENGGSILYFDITESGTGLYNMTTIRPSKPNPVIKIGSVEKWSTGGASNGRIIVRIDYGESLQTLHDVDISGAVTGDIIRKTNGVWHNSDSLTESEANIVDLQVEIADIKIGTTIVKKAEQDKNGNDIVDTYATKADTYTKTEVDNKVASVYNYKGSVDTFDDLPSTGLTTGDVYNVIDSGINYAWTGSEWDDIGGVEALATASNNGLMSKEDFSKLLALYDKATLDGLLGGKVDKTTTVNGKALSSNITLVKADVGLGNADNTSDANKPISTATQTALDLKVNKSDIVDNLTSTDTNKPLSAKQGKVLNDTKENLSNKATNFSVVNDTKYPTTKAIFEIGLDTPISALGNKTLKEVFGNTKYTLTGWGDNSVTLVNLGSSLQATALSNGYRGVHRLNVNTIGKNYYTNVKIKSQAVTNIIIGDGSNDNYSLTANVYKQISKKYLSVSAHALLYQNLLTGQSFEFYDYYMVDLDAKSINTLTVETLDYWISVYEYILENGSYSYILSEIENVNTKVDEQITLSSVSIFENIGFCGDSYVKGQLFNDDGLIGDKPNISWGSVLSRRNGINGYIYASSGADTNTWKTRVDCMPLLLSEPPRGLYLFCLGINDYSYVTLGSMSDINDLDYINNPNTFYGNYGKIIMTLKTFSPLSRIVLMTPYHKTTSVYYNYCITALQEITEHYQIPLIDVKDSLIVDTDLFENNTKGGHPTTYLYSVMSKDIQMMLEKTIDDNIEYFEEYYGV